MDIDKLVTSDLDWQIDDEGDDCAIGVEYEYIIDGDDQLAVFKGGTLAALRENGCLRCAETMGDAIECIRKRQIRDDLPERIQKFVNGAICKGKH